MPEAQPDLAIIDETATWDLIIPEGAKSPLQSLYQYYWQLHHDYQNFCIAKETRQLTFEHVRNLRNASTDALFALGEFELCAHSNQELILFFKNFIEDLINDAQIRVCYRNIKPPEAVEDILLAIRHGFIEGALNFYQRSRLAIKEESLAAAQQGEGWAKELGWFIKSFVSGNTVTIRHTDFTALEI